MSDLSQNETSGYDSRPDTLAHIEQVRTFIEEVVGDLQHRARYKPLPAVALAQEVAA